MKARPVRERLDKIKKHVKDQKTKYLVVGGVVVGAVVGGTIVYFKLKVDGVDVINNATATVGDLAENATVNIDQSMTTIIELVRRGHPGFKIQCVETGETFASVKRAADVLGIARTSLQRHLNGDLPNAGGHTFVNLGEMS